VSPPMNWRAFHSLQARACARRQGFIRYPVGVVDPLRASERVPARRSAAAGRSAAGRVRRELDAASIYTRTASRALPAFFSAKGGPAPIGASSPGGCSSQAPLVGSPGHCAKAEAS
jgi:hypothetical protein